MMPQVWRPGDVNRWLRLPLLVPAALYRFGATVRALRHQRAAPALPRPAIVVGNLTVGGTGKTPVVGWLVSALAAQGVRAGVIVHPEAADERAWHAAHPGNPIVIADRDRRRGGLSAAAQGAEVLVFDDGLQHPGLRGAFRMALVAAEQEELSPWPVPAGPWRSARRLLDHADVIVVTRKTTSAEAATGLARRLGADSGRPTARVHLRLVGFQRLHGGAMVAPERLQGAKVLAVAGVADPMPFRAQLEALGATVRLRAFPDHHPYHPRDIVSLLQESGPTDYVVVTSKDAVKLCTHWPAQPDPLVAELAVEWEGGVQPEPSAAGCRWSA
jgi:tetraacyldisaccharide 4'-kinase